MMKVDGANKMTTGGPLAGTTVIDFSRMLSGPFCTQSLGDLGATVIKVESPEGDDVRRYTPPAVSGESAYYLSTNRNKKSIVLDLKNESGRKMAHELIRKADVLVENFSNGVTERLQIDYRTARSLNENLVYCSISGFGRDIPSEIARAGYDAMFQASSGFMSMTGEKDRDPMRVPVPVMDLSTGITATNAVLAGLLARPKVGGQFIEIAMIDVAISLLSFYAMAHLVDGSQMERMGNRAPIITPSDAFQVKDGLIFITCGNDKLFRALCTAVGKPELADMPEFADNTARRANHTRLRTVLEARFKEGSQAEWLEKLLAHRVPAAPVRTVKEALKSDDVIQRKLVEMIPHSPGGTVPNIRSPYLMSGSPLPPAVGAPTLGEHTRSVLRDLLDIDDRGVEELARGGCFGNARI
jgi:formyl-CoA transferase